MTESQGTLLGSPIPDDISEERVAEFVDHASTLESAIRSVLVGQDEVVRQAVIVLLAGGHALMEGVPGLGKTMLVHALADALDLSFSRVQFTPDLMPADITGTSILQEDEHGHRGLAFRPGPLFAHVVLADEINRATPKTQSALLEAMQEGTVTVGTETHRLPNPFFVLATQNPLEMEGTYPLPEAQLDRFQFKIIVPFPGANVLRSIVARTLKPIPSLSPVLAGDQLSDMIEVARAVPIASSVVDYAIAIVLATHPGSSEIDAVRQFVRAGASPRGLQSLVIGSQVRALLEGRYNVSVDDLVALAAPALRHRVLLNFEGEAEGITTDNVIDNILQHVPAP